MSVECVPYCLDCNVAAEQEDAKEWITHTCNENAHKLAVMSGGNFTVKCGHVEVDLAFYDKHYLHKLGQKGT